MPSTLMRMYSTEYTIARVRILYDLEVIDTYCSHIVVLPPHVNLFLLRWCTFRLEVGLERESSVN